MPRSLQKCGGGSGTERWRAQSLTSILQYVSTFVASACVENDRRHHKLVHAVPFKVLLLLLLLMLHASALCLSLCVQSGSNLGQEHVFRYRSAFCIQTLVIFIDFICFFSHALFLFGFC